MAFNYDTWGSHWAVAWGSSWGEEAAVGKIVRPPVDGDEDEILAFIMASEEPAGSWN